MSSVRVLKDKMLNIEYQMLEGDLKYQMLEGDDFKCQA